MESAAWNPGARSTGRFEDLAAVPGGLDPAAASTNGRREKRAAAPGVAAGDRFGCVSRYLCFLPRSLLGSARGLGRPLLSSAASGEPEGAVRAVPYSVRGRPSLLTLPRPRMRAYYQVCVFVPLKPMAEVLAVACSCTQLVVTRGRLDVDSSSS